MEFYLYCNAFRCLITTLSDFDCDYFQPIKFIYLSYLIPFSMDVKFEIKSITRRYIFPDLVLLASIWSVVTTLPPLNKTLLRGTDDSERRIDSLENVTATTLIPRIHKTITTSSNDTAPKTGATIEENVTRVLGLQDVTTETTPKSQNKVLSVLNDNSTVENDIIKLETGGTSLYAQNGMNKEKVSDAGEGATNNSSIEAQNNTEELNRGVNKKQGENLVIEAQGEVKNWNKIETFNENKNTSLGVSVDQDDDENMLYKTSTNDKTVDLNDSEVEVKLLEETTHENLTIKNNQSSTNEDYHKSTTVRSENARSLTMNIDKYLSSDFYRKNTYTMSLSPETKRFVNFGKDDKMTSYKSQEYSTFDFNYELTTPKIEPFDTKFNQMKDNITDNLEIVDKRVEESRKEMEKKRSENEQTSPKSNNSKMEMDMKKIRRLEGNESKVRNEIKKDYVSESGVKMSFSSSYNDTINYDDSPKDDAINKIPKSKEQSGKENEQDKAEVLEEEAKRVETKNNIMTKKPDLLHLKTSYNNTLHEKFILTNNIEVETTTVAKLRPTVEKIFHSPPGNDSIAVFKRGGSPKSVSSSSRGKKTRIFAVKDAADSEATASDNKFFIQPVLPEVTSDTVEATTQTLPYTDTSETNIYKENSTITSSEVTTHSDDSITDTTAYDWNELNSSASTQIPDVTNIFISDTTSSHEEITESTELTKETSNFTETMGDVDRINYTTKNTETTSYTEMINDTETSNSADLNTGTTPIYTGTFSETYLTDNHTTLLEISSETVETSDNLYAVTNKVTTTPKESTTEGSRNQSQKENFNNPMNTNEPRKTKYSEEFVTISTQAPENKNHFKEPASSSTESSVTDKDASDKSTQYTLTPTSTTVSYDIIKSNDINDRDVKTKSTTTSTTTTSTDEESVNEANKENDTNVPDIDDDSDESDEEYTDHQNNKTNLNSASGGTDTELEHESKQITSSVITHHQNRKADRPNKEAVTSRSSSTMKPSVGITTAPIITDMLNTEGEVDEESLSTEGLTDDGGDGGKIAAIVISIVGGVCLILLVGLLVGKCAH